MGEVSGGDDPRKPRPLREDDDVGRFDSGQPELDEWLKVRAWKNEVNRASRTWVLEAEGRVVGYYTLATGSVSSILAPGKIRRNMPDPIPVMLLGRLAVDREWQGRGVGGGLLRDAIRRTLIVGETAGVRAMLVHAISADDKRFYERNGFRPSPLEPMTLMLSLVEAERELARQR